MTLLLENRLSEPLSRPESSADAALERLQLALDAGAIIGTWGWDIPNDHFVADERFARSFGLPVRECLSGLPLHKVTESIHPDDRERVQTAIAEAMARGGSYRCEYRVLQHDGVYRWIEANGRAELAEDGSAIRFPGVLLDIQARRLAEAERDRVSALLETFTAAVPGVVYAKDLDGRMLVANQGTTDLIGKPPSFYLGKTDIEFLNAGDQARRVMENDQRIMRTGISEQVEERVDMPDGTAATWLSVKAPLLDKEGRVIGLIGSSVDVTDRKNAEDALKDLNHTLEDRVASAVREREAVEAALRQAQKMEAVGQLSGGVAHDFNNLLAGISGSHELIKLRLSQGRFTDIERYLTVAQDAAQRAAALTHRLLAFSRRQTLAPVPTNLKALIGGMEELVSRSVGPAINVRAQIAADSWSVLVDPAQVENALVNLCINSRDALPDGGDIIIRTSNIPIGSRIPADLGLDAGDYVLLSVADSGSGMAPDIVAKAFDPFFTTKPLGAGTGLGLSMVYGFAKQSGGGVKIDSQEGSGTTVSLYLPRHDTVPKIVSEGLPHTLQGKLGQTILIVEDEPSIRMLIVEVLTGLEYTVLEAVDSKAGLLLLESDVRIDMLISDVGLPGGMNGRQMTDAGRRNRPELPVLFITGYAQSNALENSHLEPFTEVLTKPFSLEALTSRVSALINKQ